MSDEQHHMQLSLYKSILEGGGVPGIDTKSEESEEGADGDYVKAASGNRSVSLWISDSSLSEFDYVSRLAMNHRIELLEENMKRCSHSLAEAKATLAVLTQENAKLTDKLVLLITGLNWCNGVQDVSVCCCCQLTVGIYNVFHYGIALLVAIKSLFLWEC